MKKRMALVVWALVAWTVGCSTTDPMMIDDDDIVVEPFDVFEIFLFPQALQRPTPGPSPSPGLAFYHLSAFYLGGRSEPSFTWTVPAVLGSVEPKGPGLTRGSATVALRVPEDGMLPLGFHEIRTRATSGMEADSLNGHVAVVENTWQKHNRATFDIQNRPAMLLRSPAFLASSDGDPRNDQILYVESATSSTIRLQRINAYASLSQGEALPNDVVVLPQEPMRNNYLEASQLSPDPSPAGLGRDEVLFSSRMDIEFPRRCPQEVCSNPIPFNIWLVDAPTMVAHTPKPMSFDTTYDRLGRAVFYAFHYFQPLWDPSPTGPLTNARISFVSDRADTSSRVDHNPQRTLGVTEIWLGELRDLDGDACSDTLVIGEQLTEVGPIGEHAWHPDGSRICFTSVNGLNWVDTTSRVVTPILLPNDDLIGVTSLSVFESDGETLIAFQAQSENRGNVYVYNEDQDHVVAVLPFPFPVRHTIFPRWHPTRQEIVHVSDYTVAPWSDLPDRLDPLSEEVFGQERTLFPSLWVVRLEEPPTFP